MTPFLQFRLWLKESAASERWLAGAGAVIAASLVAWAVFPIGGGPEPGGTTAGVVTVSPGTAPAGGAPVDDVGIAADSLAAAPAGTAPGNGTPAATASAASPRSQPGAPPTGLPAPAGTAGGSGSGPLRATDTGVGVDTIKVGFGVIDVGGIGLAGYASGTRADIPEVVDALVERANEEGGVNGRRIVAAKRSADIINANDQRQTCLEFTEDDKVFAVMDSFALLYASSKACVTIEHRTPLITGNPGSAEAVAKAAPFQISPQNDDTRKVRYTALGAKDQGFFDPSKGFRKLGLLTDNCEASAIDGPGGLKETLRAIGIRDWSEFRSDCDLVSQQRGGQPAVLQHAQDGVTHVLIATQGGLSGAYIDAANTQRYKPKYFVGDYLYTTVDGIADGFNPDQFDRTRGVTVFRTGEMVQNRPLSPLGQKCNDILVEHGLPPIDNFTRNFEVLMLCENFELFLIAARSIPPNALTRQALAEAVTTVSEFHAAFEDLARFGPGKHTGGDTVKYVEWRRECACWHQISEFEPAW